MPVVKSPPLFWAPDKDPSWGVNPGVLTELVNLVPTMRGTLTNYACTPGEIYNPCAPATFATARPTSAAFIKLGSSTSPQQSRLIIGCSPNGGDGLLLEATPSGTNTFINVSNATQPYSGAEWAFTSYGDIVIATCGTGAAGFGGDVLPQVSESPGAPFVNISNSTIRGVVCTVNQGHLVLGNVTDGTNTYGDGWACSGLNNIKGTGSWVTSLAANANLATGANYGRLFDTAGTIRNLVNLRDMIIAYKIDSVYIGRRTGNPLTWSWALVADGVGCGNANGVAVVEGAHYFIHRTGVYRFDGSSVTNIGRGTVNSFLARKLNAYGVFDSSLGPRAVVDDQRNLIYWYVSAQDNGRTPGKCALVLNYVTGQFGWIEDSWSDNTSSPTSGFGCPVRGSREAALMWSSNAQSYPGMFTVGQTSAGLISMRVPIIGASSLALDTRCGFATGEIGDEANVTTLTAIKPRLVIGDGDLQRAECVVDGKMSQADYFTDEGFHLRGLATGGTGTGGLTSSGGAVLGAFGKPSHTVAAGDYLSFEAKLIAGFTSALLAPGLGIRLGYVGGTTADVLQAPPVFGGWYTVRVSLASDLAKVISSWAFMIGPPGVPDLIEYRAVFRRVRITDAAGLTRRRLWNANEERVFGGGWTLQTNYVGVRPFSGFKSYGTAFTYDPVQRRFQGARSWRWHRATMALINRADIASLEIEMSAAGKE